MSESPIHVILSAPPQDHIVPPGRFRVEVHASAPLSPWPIEALQLHGVQASDLQEHAPGRHWSLLLTPVQSGSVKVILRPAHLRSQNGAPIITGPALLRFHAAPEAVIEGPRPLIDGQNQIFIHWSKPVAEQASKNFLTDGLNLDSITIEGPSTWILLVTPRPLPTEVALTIPAGMITDGLGIANPVARWHSYAIPPGPESVRPIMEHVTADPDGTFIATWGYINDNPARTVRIAVGQANRFVPGPPDQGQPNIFLPGRHVAVFEVPFAAGNLVWSLRSPNGSRRTATAASAAAIRRI